MVVTYITQTTDGRTRDEGRPTKQVFIYTMGCSHAATAAAAAAALSVCLGNEEVTVVISRRAGRGGPVGRVDYMLHLHSRPPPLSIIDTNCTKYSVQTLQTCAHSALLYPCEVARVFYSPNARAKAHDDNFLVALTVP